MGPSAASPRPRFDLVLISVLILFLELACIRWFPAHVLYLTFFTNIVLLACFLGMSLGCLAANGTRNYLAATPYFLGISLAAGLAAELLGYHLQTRLDIHASREVVFFGTKDERTEIEPFKIPMEV